MYVIRILLSQPVRLLLTLSGIALCIILMMFLLGIYNGVAGGSVDYIKYSGADIWVLQANATNLLRGTSILPDAYSNIISKDRQIESVSPVLLLLTSVETGNQNATVFLTGYIPGMAGGPPLITAGRNIRCQNEIVLDESFAEKYNVSPGQVIHIQGDSLIVAGLSSGTNAFVIQYAFVCLEYAQSLIEYPGLASLFIIKTRPDTNPAVIEGRIENKLPGRLSVYSQSDFLKNNIREMESGILPLFYAIAIIGGVVLTIILSLILSVNILERRKDFAIMKIIGSPVSYLDGIIVMLVLLLSLSSEIAAVLMYFPLVKIVEAVFPEINTQLNYSDLIYITAAVCIISFVSTMFSLKRIRKIYPLEVFT